MKIHSFTATCLSTLMVMSIVVVCNMYASAVMAGQTSAAYFSETYQEARLKFLAAAKSAGGVIEHHLNPRTGAAGEALYTDVVTFGLPGADSALVVGSGTHGVEGFAGSAIQVGLLQQGIASELPDNVGLLFYHALNPYGFSHLRRFNEDNVDLNRNFVDRYEAQSNRDYEQMAWIFEPQSLLFWENIKAKVGLAWYRVNKGARWLQSAISRGQYSHPAGVFYGGANETRSNLILRDIVRRHLSRVSRVVLVDVHTGLGEYASAEVITEIDPGTPSYEWMSQCWETPVTNPRAGDAVSPPITGSLKQAFANMLSHAEVMGGSLEFGTYPPLEVLWALRAENHVHHHGGMKHPEAEAIKKELRRVFYPTEAEWRNAAWDQGSRLVRATLDCLR